MASLLFVGNPNSGKTTLFNHFTGSRYKTVNYPGATVDVAIASWEVGGQKHQVLDTPGIVSIIPQTEDEQVTRSVLENSQTVLPQGFGQTLVVAVVDALQLSRHLVLVLQLKEAGFKMVMALTMMDEIHKVGKEIDVAALSVLLGMPVVPIEGRTGKGTEVLKHQCKMALDAFPKSDGAMPQVVDPDTLKKQFAWADNLVSLVTRLSPYYTRHFDPDRIFLHPVWGGIGFVVSMGFLFWSIFALANPFIELIDGSFSGAVSFLQASLPTTWWSALLTQGVLASVGSVMVFIPQIALLFLMMGLMESSGYLARGAVLVDKPLSVIGLNGRSFVPLLSGCACAIPAMMAARTIPGKKEKILTLLMIPLMTCSARLPVYGLLLTLLLGADHPWKSAIGMTLIYLGSLAIASIIAALAGRLLRLPSTPGFHIELPRWHRPILKHILASTYDQTLSFIKKAGPTIIGVGIILWVLSSYPTSDHTFMMQLGHWLTPVLQPMGVDWRVGVALLLAFAAREVFVSALTLIFLVGQEGPSSLITTLKIATFSGTSQLIFTPASIVGLILFFMISMQCASTLAVAKKEMGGWKIPVGMTLIYIGLAYALSVLAVQGMHYLGF